MTNICVWTTFIIGFPTSAFFAINIVREYERAIICRHRRPIKGGLKLPGKYFVLPFVDQIKKVTMSDCGINLHLKEIMLVDSITVNVDATIYYKVFDVTKAIRNVTSLHKSTHMHANMEIKRVM